MSWVEFPVLKVMSRVEWEKELSEGRVAVVPVAEGIGRIEKRQIDDGWAGRKRMKTDADVDADVGATGVPTPAVSVSGVGSGLAGLGDYESDEEMEEAPGAAGEVTEDDIRMMRTLGAAAAADMA